MLCLSYLAVSCWLWSTQWKTVVREGCRSIQADADRLISLCFFWICAWLRILCFVILQITREIVILRNGYLLANPPANDTVPFRERRRELLVAATAPGPSGACLCHDGDCLVDRHQRGFYCTEKAWHLCEAGFYCVCLVFAEWETGFLLGIIISCTGAGALIVWIALLPFVVAAECILYFALYWAIVGISFAFAWTRTHLSRLGRHHNELTILPAAPSILIVPPADASARIAQPPPPAARQHISLTRPLLNTFLYPPLPSTTA
jgi:hypothetical protein